MRGPASIFAVVLLLTVVSLSAEQTSTPAPAESPDTSKASGGAQDASSQDWVAADVLSSMDRTMDPCVDFHRYACGGWLDATELPSDESTWIRSFSEVRERNKTVIREILEQAAAKPGNDPDRRRVGTYFASCMDEEAVDKAGAAPLAPFLDRIAEVKDLEGFFTVTGELHRLGAGSLFDGSVLPDFVNPEMYIVFVSQGGIGMPDREYYVSDDQKMKDFVTAYRLHIAEMLQLLGEKPDEAGAHAAAIVDFETALAEVSRTRTEMRNLPALYNKLDIGGLQELAPSLPWHAYLKAIGYPKVVDISVATPEFFEALAGLLAGADVDLLRAYLRWHLVTGTANRLSADFVDANFDFFSRTLSGQQEIQPRWKRCVSATQGALGEVVGKIYVDRMFAGDSKAVALEMINDIEAAFGANLEQVQWMDDTTRERAAEKLATLGNKIGYPDTWRDYSKLEIRPGRHFANAAAATGFDFDFQMARVGKPLDRSEWDMPPQVVNAYYHPIFNEMVFPAGILQPPFFHRDFPAAMNYGAIGGGIAHELTHGYDDQGRLFDAQGRMREWWEPEVSERFAKQTECIRDFYSAYEVEPGLNVNGELSLGENIADIGGLKHTWAAYKLWEKRHGATKPAVEGLSNDQLFFVAWAQVWCTETTPEALRMMVTTDPHTPEMFRAIGPVSHHPAFAETFECKAGAPMVPENQCVLW